LVDNIDNIQIRNFLQAVRVALILPKNLFETEIDGLIGEITDAEKREVCQNLITRFRKDHTEDMGEYGIALNYYIERRDIVSMARICHKSKDTDIIKLAIKSINDSSYSFQEAVRHELFQISKALIYCPKFGRKTPHLQCVVSTYKMGECNIIRKPVIQSTTVHTT
jgi:hypothetical protein